MVHTAKRLLGLGADPRIHCRRGKQAVYVARENFREDCAIMIEVHDGYVERMINHKTADPFYIALTIAGLEKYFGVLGIEVNCHDMRLLTDNVLLPESRLVPLGFRPCELKRIVRMARNRTLGRTSKIVLSDNRMTSVLPIISTYGYVFEYDCLDLNPNIYDYLSAVHTRKMNRLHKEIIEADANIIDVKKKAIEDFWSGAQGKGNELAHAQRYASKRNIEEMGIIHHDEDDDKNMEGNNNQSRNPDVDIVIAEEKIIIEQDEEVEKNANPATTPPQQQPTRPEKDNNNNPVGNTSPRHRKLVAQNTKNTEKND